MNGIPRHTGQNFADYTGYVPQLATPYYENLTVSENLLYSSVLRLPKCMSWHDRIGRVLQVMGEVGYCAVLLTLYLVTLFHCSLRQASFRWPIGQLED
jgi:hypothetical protein